MEGFCGFLVVVPYNFSLAGGCFSKKKRVKQVEKELEKRFFNPELESLLSFGNEFNSID